VIGREKGGTPVGVVLAIAAATVYAVYILAGTKAMQNVAPLAAAAVVICSTAAVYGGIVFVQGPVWPGTVAGWLSIAALSIFCTVVAIALFFAGLERVGPTSASILSTFEPAVAVALAALLLGEAVTVSQIAGGALILAAVAMTVRSDVHRERAGGRSSATP
jgi:drug/metabolite transporter (DMT)-like permease